MIECKKVVYRLGLDEGWYQGKDIEFQANSFFVTNLLSEAV